MTWDPDEKYWKRDQDGYDPSKDGPEARMQREAERRSGRGIHMDDRRCEKEPSRCLRKLPNGTNCNGAQYLEAAVETRFLAVGAQVEHRIPTPWPVAVCHRCGAREEM